MKTLEIQKLDKLPFATDEQINQLRINLSFSGADIKTIMVTSSVPNEGKSYVAFQLWRKMAEVGQKVLFVDSDLRNSQIRRDFGIELKEEDAGFIYYLAGKAKLEDVIYKTSLEKGYIVPLYKNISNPVMLLEGHRYKDLIDTCAKDFDYIIIDTPPIGRVADALKIATYCDGSLLVARSNGVSKSLLKNSIDLLTRTGTPLLGVALNRMENAHKGSYYYSYYYSDYGYGYGESSDGTKKKKKKKRRKKDDD